MGEKGKITLSEFIQQPVARVWKALTDPALLARWWAPGDVKAVVGYAFELDMGGQFGKQACEVIAVEPERLFSYHFAKERLGTVITWTLAAEGAGTRLAFEQAGFDLDSPMGKMAFQGMGAGWPMILKKIGAAIEGAAE